METFRTIIMIALSVISIYLAFRCIVLTRACKLYSSLIANLVNEEMTRDNLKILSAAMYGVTIEEFERRMKK